MELSVLMAVKDGEAHLAAAMDSLLGQSFTAFELIVVDDGSRDATPSLLADYQRRDRRVMVLHNDQPQGLPTALNRGLARCRAPLVARADGDDVYHPERLGRQLDHLRRHPEIGVLSCGYHRIDSGGRRIDTRVPVTGDAPLRFQMLFMNGLLHPGVMFRADPVRRVGGYDPRYWTAQDSDLWARLLPLTRLDNLPEPLVSYRIHPHSTMRRRGDAGLALSLSVPARLQAHYLGFTPDPRQVRAVVDLYQDFVFLEHDAIALGYRGLRRVLDLARRREPAPVWRAFRRRVGAALQRQARLRAGRDPGRALRVLGKAIQWRLPGSPWSPPPLAVPVAPDSAQRPDIDPSNTNS